MAQVPEPLGTRIAPELGYRYGIAAPPWAVTRSLPEAAILQSALEAYNAQVSLQRARAAAERALAASHALEPRHAPLAVDLAAAVQEAQVADQRMQALRTLLEGAAGWPAAAPAPPEVAPPTPGLGIPALTGIQAVSAWAAAAAARAAREPPVEIQDTGKDLLVRLELPGVQKDEVEVQARDRSLYVRAESEREEGEREQIVATERLTTRFERRVPLPEFVVPAKANATFKDGILEVTLPKKHPGEPPQRVSVK